MKNTKKNCKYTYPKAELCNFKEIWKTDFNDDEVIKNEEKKPVPFRDSLVFIDTDITENLQPHLVMTVKKYALVIKFNLLENS